MGCLPVCGDDPRALVSGLSYIQVDKHGIRFYTTVVSVDLVHDEIFHGKGGIMYHTSIINQWRVAPTPSVDFLRL